MKLFVKNPNLSLALALTALRLVGFWAPEGLAGGMKTAYNAYAAFSFMLLLGIYLITQSIDLFVIWGNIPLMTATAFILFTNLAQAAKFINLAVREKQIRGIVDGADLVLRSADGDEAKAIVKNCDRQTRIQLIAFFTLTLVTITGFATSAESGNLPLRAWYPYDTTKSPAYELTYAHQVYALFVAAFLNVAKDTVVTSLLAQCHCRLQLLSLSLKTLCHDLSVTGVSLLTPNQEKTLSSRIKRCAAHHQTALEAASQMQLYFSEPTFAQFNVSLVIICVTAFQLVSVSRYIIYVPLLTPNQEKTLRSRIKRCAAHHQTALEAASQMQLYFSEPTFAQFNVSLVIICVTAFQLVSVSRYIIYVPLLTPNQEKTLRSRIKRCAAHHQTALEAASQMQLYFSEPTFAQFNVSLVIICVTAFQLVSVSRYIIYVPLLTPNQEKTLRSRIKRCAAHHQTALEAASQMQLYFSEPTFAQFNVSLVIICVTAFQLVSQTGNMVRLLSMCTYLVNMMFQVFLYCYQGNQLSEESSEIAGAAYLSPWYTMSPARRRDILFIMTRSRRVARITAGGFTTLSLASFMASSEITGGAAYISAWYTMLPARCREILFIMTRLRRVARITTGGFTTLSLASFMAIIKASYSLFTLLKQVDETN